MGTSVGTTGQYREEDVIPSPLRRWSGGVLWKDKFACFCRIVVYLLPRVSKGGIYPAPTTAQNGFGIGSEACARVEESIRLASLAQDKPVKRRGNLCPSAPQISRLGLRPRSK